MGFYSLLVAPSSVSWFCSIPHPPIVLFLTKNCNFFIIVLIVIVSHLDGLILFQKADSKYSG